MNRLVTSFIFRSVVQFLFFIINIFAAYLMLRGHNAPGGGFIAGLATGISLILLSLGIGLQQLDRHLRFDPVRLAAGGLLLATLTSLAPVFFGRAFLAHAHLHLHMPLLGDLHLGTPMLFDGGVYLVVVGISCKIILLLGKSTLGLVTFPPAERVRYSSPLEREIEEPEEPGGGPHAA